MMTADLRQSALMRLLTLLTLFFFLLLVAAASGAAIALIPGIQEKTSLLLASAIQCLFAFCFPAWLTARFSSDSPNQFLSLTRKPGIKPYIGVLIVYLLALPAMNQLIAWNEAIHFPEWASGLEKTLREMEDNNGGVAIRLLSGNTFVEMIICVLIVGVLTGFSEEIFFRGALQKIFIESRISINYAVWFAAIIFSAMHFQFFGFFPRLLMGAFFGYLVCWSGSLWPAVFAHALNNSIVVISVWIIGTPDGGGIDSFGVADGSKFPIDALASALATLFFLHKFRKLFFYPQSLTQSDNGKEIE